MSGVEASLFFNSILFNSEVWQSLTIKHMNDLPKVDHYLLRSILGAHSKVPIIFLFLETASLTIKNITASRRMIYMQTLLKRKESELTRRVGTFEQLKQKCSSDNWYTMIMKDFEYIKLTLEEDKIVSLSDNNYKDLIKRKVRQSVFKELNEKKLLYKKIKAIEYSDLNKTQKYLVDHSFSGKMRSMLCNLRSHCVRGIKDNFCHQYQTLICDLCSHPCFDQQHPLQCVSLQHVQRD